jgi:predicted nucleic acid-binding protein
MVYADTSVLLALFLNELKTQDAWRWVKQQQAGSIAASDWTLTEFSSALAVKVRMKAIDADAHGKTLFAVKRFALNDLMLIKPEKADFHRAAELCDHWQMGLRAGDALHLAIAERHGLTVCTLDKVMKESALALGLQTESV